MKLLVTGGAGFIGSAVVKRAICLGHDVVNLDALTYSACLSNLAEVDKNSRYTFEHVNICDRQAVDSVFARHLPDAVMHLAAESHVDRSIDGPRAFIQTNVLGTFELLEASRMYWVQQGRPDRFRFHHVSTDEVFGSLPFDDGERFKESTPYDPRSPYSASKAGSDHLVRAWHETFGLPVVLSNCSNNYGPFHFPEKLIPVVIINAITGRALPIYGDGGNVRDWLHVDDHAEALLLVLERGQSGRSYNIGGDSECSNLELVRRLCTILDRRRPRAKGSYTEQITFVPDRPGHDKRYAIDTSRIQQELGWSARTSLNAGLEQTVDWYLANEHWWQALIKRQGVGQRLGTAK